MLSAPRLRRNLSSEKKGRKGWTFVANSEARSVCQGKCECVCERKREGILPCPANDRQSLDWDWNQFRSARRENFERQQAASRSDMLMRSIRLWIPISSNSTIREFAGNVLGSLTNETQAASHFGPPSGWLAGGLAAAPVYRYDTLCSCVIHWFRSLDTQQCDSRAAILSPGRAEPGSPERPCGDDRWSERRAASGKTGRKGRSRRGGGSC